jgi:hypothetical protein
MPNDIVLLQGKKKREKKKNILVKDTSHVLLGGLRCSKSRP